MAKSLLIKTKAKKYLLSDQVVYIRIIQKKQLREYEIESFVCHIRDLLLIILMEQGVNMSESNGDYVEKKLLARYYKCTFI